MATATTKKQLAARYRKLQEILNSCRKVLVAYSGGVDSTFLLKVAVDCLGRQNVLACIGASESLAGSELETAGEIARQIGAEVQIVYPREMSNPNYTANSADRCFYCKSELYQLLSKIAQHGHYDAVLCGTNADDLGDFRPGLRAAKKFDVKNPLAEAGLNKDDIRVLSKKLALATWNKPAQPCLASRMAYGLEITPERLKQIEKAEEFLRSTGLYELRVRHHGNMARIEVPVDKIPELVKNDRRNEIVAFFKKLGFTYVSLDLQGFRSGSANEVL